MPFQDAMSFIEDQGQRNINAMQQGQNMQVQQATLADLMRKQQQEAQLRDLLPKVMNSGDPQATLKGLLATGNPQAIALAGQIAPIFAGMQKQDRRKLETVYDESGRPKQVWMEPGQTAQEGTFAGYGKPETSPTELAKLTNEMNALPPGDPRRVIYQNAITKATTHAPAASANVTFKQEGEEAKTVGKGFGEQYVELQKAGMAAGGKIARYERMGNLLQGVSTGKLTPTTTQLAAVGESLGIKLDPNLDAKQAAEALSNEIALQLRSPSGGAGMPGAMSDQDRQFLASMAPGLSKTPGGNTLIIDTAKKMAKRDQEVATLARNYRSKHGSIDEGFFNELETFSNKNPLFPAVNRPANRPPLSSFGR